jgi:tetratricopeptide (TPR) repeat protein
MYERAIRDLNESIRLDPQPIIYNELGMSYESLEEHDKAIQAYDAAIRIDPEYYVAYWNLGTADLLWRRNYRSGLTKPRIGTGHAS